MKWVKIIFEKDVKQHLQWLMVIMKMRKSLVFTVSQVDFGKHCWALANIISQAVFGIVFGFIQIGIESLLESCKPLNFECIFPTSWWLYFGNQRTLMLSFHGPAIVKCKFIRYKLPQTEFDAGNIQLYHLLILNTLEFMFRNLNNLQIVPTSTLTSVWKLVYP